MSTTIIFTVEKGNKIYFGHMICTYNKLQCLGAISYRARPREIKKKSWNANRCEKRDKLHSMEGNMYERTVRKVSKVYRIYMRDNSWTNTLKYASVVEMKLNVENMHRNTLRNCFSFKKLWIATLFVSFFRNVNITHRFTLRFQSSAHIQPKQRIL